VLTLGRLGGPGAVAALQQLAARRPAAEREPVWVALQYHPSALALEALRIAAFLGGPDAPAAALCLGTALRQTTRRRPDGRRAADRALETLRLLARYTTGPLARAALLAAGRQGDPTDLELLVERLDRGTPAERRIAAAALGAHADDRADRALARALDQDPDAGVRSAAAWSLGRREAQVAVEPLLRALRRPGDLAAINASAALGRLGLRRLAPRLAARLDHVNPSVRANLAWALGQCRDDRSVGRLRRRLRHDPAAMVRRAAGLALARILGRGAARDLGEAAARESDLAVETDLREAEGVALGWGTPRRRTGTARWLEVRLAGSAGRTALPVVQVVRLADGLHLAGVTDESGALLLEDVAPGPAWLVGAPRALPAR
jgi:HEAT repeat protein